MGRFVNNGLWSQGPVLVLSRYWGSGDDTHTCCGRQISFAVCIRNSSNIPRILSRRIGHGLSEWRSRKNIQALALHCCPFAFLESWGRMKMTIEISKGALRKRGIKQRKPGYRSLTAQMYEKCNALAAGLPRKCSTSKWSVNWTSSSSTCLAYPYTRLFPQPSFP